jgi:hypothetical protein
MATGSFSPFSSAAGFVSVGLALTPAPTVAPRAEPAPAPAVPELVVSICLGWVGLGSQRVVLLSKIIFYCKAKE